MDCEMPVKDGFEATQELVALMNEMKIKTIPIIACTAFNDEEHRDACFECGMSVFLNKPVMLDELRKTLRELNAIFT